ncbi:MAG: sugar phosphate isomerase/epimerase [Microbacterium sp.]|uniref:sugar phosphate isomerase/epimerase family protein n=2 Tax=Microbacterium sp. TaxID=51671 RepID=UPI001AD3DEEF|nr:sugar phosphate isomerase/epimerase family protein [Microbacterium sp.]MBN9154525.1 sugar phosphate isomerase/epimerase [Microbacterium sp.]
MTPDLDVACHVNVLAPDASPASLAAALPVLADLGYRRVVLPPLDPAATDVARIRSLFAEAGVTPIVIAVQGPGADVSSEDETVRSAGGSLLRGALDLAVALGADQLNGVPYGLFGPPGGPTPPDAFERSAREVGRVADEAHERGVTMTFEVLNRYETSLVNTARQAMDYVGASGSPHLRIHLDTFHMAVEEADAAAAIRTALPALHYLELGQSGRGDLASGAVDVGDVVRQALDDGYAGRWGVEAFSRSVLPAAAADGLAIWRAPYDDGAAVAENALRVIRAGWAASVVGRRASRLARAEQPADTR